MCPEASPWCPVHLKIALIARLTTDEAAPKTTSPDNTPAPPTGSQPRN